ncbi:SRPBCC family protein [Mycobacteroides saopaulense]|uniref:ATPase n=1 Tax=Mycobacteroides saopaulense TaxID=1578165 RepID=A0ABX3C691_9MYCO|nr:SRPBCC family protein [Mycobacteroides saopaulense]OHT89140.1 ATPase [Mycobacteroides saopaulense]OHU13961.1 ATPase [Mycobacteroides saopaulense]
MSADTNRYGSATVELPSDTTILITRSFDAPAALIFRTLTEPELVKRWWGFETARWQVCEIDLRVGGRWRYVVSQPCESEPDMEVAFHGEYREIDAPHRLVSTEVFEGVPDGEALVSTTLDQIDGVTTMRVLVQHSCKEHRDGHIDSGMEAGMQVSYDRIEDLLRDLG